jgi:isoleucyl-tRNA synthetase
VVALVTNFMVNDLSAFYFDIRKDALYCDPISSVRRKGALTAIEAVFDCLVKWLAPLLPFTAEESWLSRHPEATSVHLEIFPDLPDTWRDEALEARWERIVRVRRVVTGALEIERREKRIGSSLEAAPTVYVADAELLRALDGEDFAEVCITSGIKVVTGEGPGDAFRLDEIPGVAVVPGLAEGRRCARSWKILPEVGSDPDYPDLSRRDAEAMRERRAAGLA